MKMGIDQAGYRDALRRIKRGHSRLVANACFDLYDNTVPDENIGPHECLVSRGGQDLSSSDK